MVSLGQKIRERRLEKKLTQAGLAEGLVSASAISQIESDKITPSYKLLVQIAERLDVPLDYFLADNKEQYLEQTTSHKLAKTFIHAKEYENAVPILQKLLTSETVDETEISKDLAECFLHLKKYNEAQDLLGKVQQLSLKDNDDNSYVWALNKLGTLFYQINNISLAIHYWKKAYDFVTGLEQFDPFLKAAVLTNLALIYSRLGHYDQSVNLYRQSEDLLTGSSDLLILAKTYMGMGRSYYGKQEYKKAEEYFQEAITIYKNRDHIKQSIQVKENIGIMLGERGEYKEALRALYECVNDYREHKLDTHTANTHAEIAKLHIRLKEFAQAEQQIDEAFAACEANTQAHAECYYARSLWYAEQSRYQEAIPDARTSMNMFLSLGAIQEYNRICLHLSDIYKKMDDYKSSTEILEESQITIQTLLKEKGITL